MCIADSVGLFSLPPENGSTHSWGETVRDSPRFGVLSNDGIKTTLTHIMKMKKTSMFGIGTLAIALLNTSITASTADETPAKDIKPYPLETCLVSGEKLGGMGEPYVINHEGQEIKFCCKDCVKSFDKEPEKYLKKLAEGEKAPDEHAGHAHH